MSRPRSTSCWPSTGHRDEQLADRLDEVRRAVADVERRTHDVAERLGSAVAATDERLAEQVERSFAHVVDELRVTADRHDVLAAVIRELQEEVVHADGADEATAAEELRASVAGLHGQLDRMADGLREELGRTAADLSATTASSDERRAAGADALLAHVEAVRHARTSSRSESERWSVRRSGRSRRTSRTAMVGSRTACASG